MTFYTFVCMTMYTFSNTYDPVMLTDGETGYLALTSRGLWLGI